MSITTLPEHAGNAEILHELVKRGGRCAVISHSKWSNGFVENLFRAMSEWPAGMRGIYIPAQPIGGELGHFGAGTHAEIAAQSTQTFHRIDHHLSGNFDGPEAWNDGNQRNRSNASAVTHALPPGVTQGMAPNATYVVEATAAWSPTLLGRQIIGINQTPSQVKLYNDGTWPGGSTWLPETGDVNLAARVLFYRHPQGIGANAGQAAFQLRWSGGDSIVRGTPFNAYGDEGIVAVELSNGSSNATNIGIEWIPGVDSAIGESFVLVGYEIYNRDQEDGLMLAVPTVIGGRRLVHYISPEVVSDANLKGWLDALSIDTLIVLLGNNDVAPVASVTGKTDDAAGKAEFFGEQFDRLIARYQAARGNLNVVVLGDFPSNDFNANNATNPAWLMDVLAARVQADTTGRMAWADCYTPCLVPDAASFLDDMTTDNVHPAGAGVPFVSEVVARRMYEGALRATDSLTADQIAEAVIAKSQTTPIQASDANGNALATQSDLGEVKAKTDNLPADTNADLAAILVAAQSGTLDGARTRIQDNGDGTKWLAYWPATGGPDPDAEPNSWTMRIRYDAQGQQLEVEFASP
ncbi:MAG: SGNH/GDSL hydrolase family protein [Planctomycetota bacterium]